MTNQEKLAAVDSLLQTLDRWDALTRLDLLDLKARLESEPEEAPVETPAAAVEKSPDYLGAWESYQASYFADGKENPMEITWNTGHMSILPTVYFDAMGWNQKSLRRLLCQLSQSENYAEADQGRKRLAHLFLAKIELAYSSAGNNRENQRGAESAARNYRKLIALAA